MALILGNHGPSAAPPSPLSLAPIHVSQLVFEPARPVSTRTGASFTALRPPGKTPHRTAPHHVQTSASASLRPPSTSSQPLQVFSSRLPTSSGVYYYSFKFTSTTAASATSETGVSWSSFSSIVSTGVASLSSSSVIPLLVSSATSTPSMSVSTAVSTAVSTTVSTVMASSSQVAMESAVYASSTDTLSTSPLPSSVPSVDEDVTSRDVGHHAPFYVVIVIGTIVAIGLIAAVIAWIIRLRLHAKRRRSAPNVPWAHHVDEDGLEEGWDATFIGQPIDRIGSGDISSQDAIPWEPRGDRDVGEPKRSNSYMRGSVRSSHLSDRFPNTLPYPVVVESLPYPTPMQLEPNGSLDGHQSSTLGPLQVANLAPGDASPGTPPPENDASRPRFLELNGEGLQVPWLSLRRSSYANRRQGGSGEWEHLPMPGETQNADGTASATYDSWTASLKSNLTHAFNAVASTLPSGPSLMKSSGAQDDDILTPRPQQGAAGRSIHSNFSSVDFNDNPLSRNTTGSSTPWSLEEREDGTGRVHFHGRAFNGYGHGTPQILGSFATLGSPSSAGTSIHRASTQESHAPLIARLPQSALLRPGAFSRIPRYSKGRQSLLSTQGSVSRTSSIYSMASRISGISSQAPAPRLPVVSRHSTMRIDTLQTVNEKKEDSESEDGVMEQRPGFVERSSSSGCSFNSYYYGSDAASGVSGDVVETEEMAHKSITGRRRKLIKAV